MPAAELAKHGHDVVIGNNIWRNRDGSLDVVDLNETRHVGAEIIIIQRWMDEHAGQAIRDARATGQVIVNDVDDHWDGLATSNGAFYGTHPKVSPHSNRNHYKAAIGASSAISVSTPFLRDYYAKLGVPVYLIPNAIDLARWEQRDVSGPLTLGWVGTTTHRSGDLESVASYVRDFLVKSGASFFQGGADNKDTEAALKLKLPDTVKRKSMPMVPIGNYPGYFRRFNAGIVPLSQVTFNLAKSCIKGMEYSAAGLPFVASDSPDYRRLRDDYGIGMVVDKAKYWPKLLDHFLDEEWRVAAGNRNRERVAQLDIETQYVNWENAYKEMLA